MSLQMVIGGAGTRRSEIMHQKLIEESLANPEKNYYLVVPEQYTMQTQMKMTELHPGRGVMNVDIVSFPRLAYRVFDTIGGIRKTILEDTGKSMVIRRLLSEEKENFEAFAVSAGKKGFTEQAKSMISELFQYSVSSEQLSESRQQVGEDTILGKKLKDIQRLYDAFKKYMADTYMTAEELLDVLADKVADADILKGSVMYIDNFTGFTPSQYGLLRKLLKLCEKVVIGLTIDVKDSVDEPGQEYQLFYLTKETLWKLKKLCMEERVTLEADILLEASDWTAHRDLKFMEKHLFRFHRFRPWSGRPEHIRLYGVSHPADEIRFAAGEIRRKMMEEKLSYKDVALVTGDMERYREAARRYFEAQAIPLFIDDKADISENSFVEMLRSAMDVILKDFSYESVFRYLRSGYSDIDAEAVDVLDNYILATGIRGKKRWTQTFVKRYRDFKEEDFLRVNESREKVVKELEPLFIMTASASVREYTQALRQFIQEIRGEEKIGYFAEAFEEDGEFVRSREYAQIFESVEELLEKYVQILGDEKISLKEYIEILEAGFGEIQVGVIPPTLDQVVLGDLKRTRLGDVKVLFILGCNDGIIPTPISVGGMLSDREKEILSGSSLELAPTGRQNSFRERFYIYTAMTRPVQQLILTFARMDGSGKAIRPSTVLSDLQYLFPELVPETPDFREKDRILADVQESGRYLLEGLKDPKLRTPLWESLFLWAYHHEEHRKALERWIAQIYDGREQRPLSSGIIRSLYGEKTWASITTLEKYAACAYAHFLSAGLRLEERKTYELLPPDLGNILHQSMERFSRAVAASDYEWATMPDDFRDKTMETCVRETGMEYQSAVFLENARYGYYLEQLVRMAKRTAWTIQKQICKGRFVPAGFETHFTAGDSVKIVGTVDRYDVYDGPEARAVRIIDYKSGRKTFDLTEIFYGLSLQLVVYLEAIGKLEEGKHPDKPLVKAGMFYYHMNDPLLEDFFENEKERDGQLASLLKMEGLVNDDPEVVSWMDSHLDELPQMIPVSLKKDGSFTKNSSVASSDQFEQLGYVVKRRVEMLAAGWMSGNIPVNPYLMMKGSKKETACDYCNYRSICQFDERIPGCQYHRLVPLSGDEVWQRIYEEVKEAWENSGQKNKNR